MQHKDFALKSSHAFQLLCQKRYPKRICVRLYGICQIDDIRCVNDDLLYTAFFCIGKSF